VATPIVTKAEMAPGANLAAAPGTWTFVDITASYRAAAGITISAGRADEAGRTQATAVTFGLNDPNGDFVPRNALGRYFPNIRQNTPFRLTFAGGVRAIVYADSYSVSWDESPTSPVVSVSASGTLRRLEQGQGPPQSAMRRHVQALAPAAYWPLEDGLSSALSGAGPMVASPSDGFAVDVNSHPVGAVGSMRRSNGSAVLTGYLATPATSSVRIDFAVQRPATNTTDPLLAVTWAGGRWLFGLNPSPLDELWHHHRLEVFNSAGTAQYDWYVDGVQVAFAATVTPPTWHDITGVRLEPGVFGFVDTDAFSHLAMWSPRISTDTYQAYLGYPGESATARMTRLCSDAGVPLALTGSSTTTMALQSSAGFLDLLRSCESADGGILSDGGTNGGLTYLARAARYNLTAAFTVDSSLLQLARPFSPVEDDQRRRNDWTISRANGGSSGRYVDATGPQGTAAVGIYDDATSVDVATDDVLVDQAAWRVHLGTVEQMRYPVVTLNLRDRPELVAPWLAAGIGSRFTVRGLPSQHQPGDVDLIVEGYSEVCDGMAWLVSINAGAYDPWRISKVADADLGRVGVGRDAAGNPVATLAAAAALGATSLSVATASGPLFTTTATFPNDFPLYVNVAGIRVKVTGISGTSSPQTFTVDGSTVVKALPNTSYVTIWKNGVVGL
jgi:hypothetical protein